MNIIIRTDASNMIGTGHVMRCLTLAEQLMKANAQTKITFISRDFPGNLSELIKSKGFDVKLLEFSEEGKRQYAAMLPNDDYAKWLGVKSKQDAQEVLDVITILNLNTKIDLLIIDHYALDLKWERLLRPKVEKIMVIDDLANREHDCDIILDHNFYLDLETRYDKLVPKSCKKLLGPKHALINPKLKYAKENRARAGKGNSLDQIENVLVFLGGADPKNFTDKALEKALSSQQLKNCLFNVVLGKNNPHKLELKQKYAQYDNVIFHVQPSYYYELLEKADLAIGAGGVSQLERCYIELPSIVISVADNQVGICSDMIKANLLFDFNKLDLLIKSKNVEELSCMPLVVQDIIKNVNNSTSFRLRPVAMSDAKNIYQWRTDPKILSFCFSKDNFSWESHLKWLASKINSRSCVFLILESGDNQLGIIRFDLLDKKSAKVSIFLNPLYLGQGLGSVLLKRGMSYFFENNNNVDKVIAEILDNNIISRKLFQKSGFKEHKNIYFYYRRALCQS
jgi:UDP-2,4-diacetamido-2,4,6-trideoxy-beta-L-altropyranose hydrolase